MTDPSSASPDVDSPEAGIRLQRFLAACGLGSRRNCEELVQSGRITVDGAVVNALGAKVNPSRQKIAFDGETLRMERKKYYLLNKPTNCLCTNRDPDGRRKVIDLFPPGSPRLFTVGRLDEHSEGLLIVTNDGDFAQKLAHPRYRIYRTYRVQVAGNPSREALDQLKQGLHFREGKFRVHEARWVRKQGKSSFLELVLGEGQNREIRRLLARIGHKVIKLQRIAFGPIRLGKLPVGEYRELTRDELSELLAIVDRNITAPPSQPRRPRAPVGRTTAVEGKDAGRPDSGASGAAGRGRKPGRPAPADAKSRRRPGTTDRSTGGAGAGAGRTKAAGSKAAGMPARKPTRSPRRPRSK